MKENRNILVFLHYFGGSAKSWDWVIAELQDEFECIALNLPGFGGSEPLEKHSIENFAKFIRDELLSKGVGAYSMVAQSMGAKVAYQMATSDDEGKIKQLILVAPTPPGIEPIEDDEKQRMLKHPALDEAKTTVENITKLPLTKEQYPLAIHTNIIADHETWRWWLNDGMNHSIENEAKDLKLPITILNSEDDPVIAPQLIKERVLSVFSHAKLITTQGCGHLSPMEKPKWIADQIRNLCAK